MMENKKVYYPLGQLLDNDLRDDEGYAAGYAAGQKAERERCHGIATEWKAKAHSNQRKETDLGVQSMYAASASTAGIIAAALEDKSDE